VETRGSESSSHLRWMFRALLVGQALFASIGGAVRGHALGTGYPPEFRAYMTRVSSESLTAGRLLGGLGSILLGSVLAAVAWIGLWRFARWGRTLFVIEVASCWIVATWLGPAFTMTTPFESLLQGIGDTMTGALLALAFLPPIKGEFARNALE